MEQNSSSFHGELPAVAQILDQEQASAECRKLYKNMVTVSLATTSNKSCVKVLIPMAGRASVMGVASTGCV